MSGRSSARAAKRRTTFRRTTKPIDPRNRLIALLMIFVIIGAGFVAVLVDLQTVRSERYRSLGEDQRTRTRQLAAYRGAVTDRNGFVLAISTPSHRVVADPTLVVDAGATAALLAPIVGVDSATLAAELTASSESDRYGLLARNVDDDAIQRIQQLDADEGTSDALVGVFIRPEEDRVYPAGELANAVVGRVDLDEQGIFGVEQRYNDEMTGIPGTEQFEVGRFGSISVGDRTIDPATAGFDIVLTIDHRIQYVTEQALIEHCEATGAQGTTAVLADPRTGEILAMASAERRDGACVVPNKNTALTDTFEPGSVIKPVVIAAAFEELSYNSETLVDVPNRITVGGKTFVDHPEHAPAPFPISDILAKSMNVGTIRVAQRLGAETVYEYLRAFGFGSPSGLGLKGESSGALRAPADWWGSDHGSIPIGQGMAVSAIQLLSAYNVIASGGDFVPPRLVETIETPGGLAHGVEKPAPRPVLGPDTVREITASLVGVVNSGTGGQAAVDGYQVAGKTGTAWKVFDDGSGKLGYGEPGNRRYIVSFVGFLPAENPQLSLVVVVDEPEEDSTAATIAAPLFAEIADYAASILLIPPDGWAMPDGERVRGTPAGEPNAAAVARRQMAEHAAAPIAADGDGTDNQ